jgi:hypothetical protein
MTAPTTAKLEQIHQRHGLSTMDRRPKPRAEAAFRSATASRTLIVSRGVAGSSANPIPPTANRTTPTIRQRFRANRFI